MEHLADAKSAVLEFMQTIAGDDSIDYDVKVANSEAAVGHRNVAMANFLKSFGNLHNEPQDVLDAYFHHCSLSMSCEQLCKASLFLANGGVNPQSGSMVITPSARVMLMR